MINNETRAAVRDAVKRVLDGRERVPGDLPYPPSIQDYMFASGRPTSSASSCGCVLGTGDLYVEVGTRGDGCDQDAA